MKITWNEDKNIELERLRGLNFEMVLAAIDDGRILADEQHSNIKNYGHQRILILDIDGYAVTVPYPKLVFFDVHSFLYLDAVHQP